MSIPVNSQEQLDIERHRTMEESKEESKKEKCKRKLNEWVEHYNVTIKYIAQYSTELNEIIEEEQNNG